MGTDVLSNLFGSARYNRHPVSLTKELNGGVAVARDQPEISKPRHAADQEPVEKATNNTAGEFVRGQAADQYICTVGCVGRDEQRRPILW